MVIFSTILWIAGILVLIYALFPAVSVTYALSKGKKKPLPVLTELSFACVILAKKDIRKSFPLIESLLKQSYANLRIYVIGDASLRPRHLPDHPALSFLFTEFQGTEVSHIRFAVNHMSDEPDVIMVLEDDMLLHKDALSNLNNLLSIGFVAVQARPAVRNILSVEDNDRIIKGYHQNSLFCEAPFRAGASSMVSGYGTAVKTWYMKMFLDQAVKSGAVMNTPVAGIMQEVLTGRGLQTAFCKNALLYEAYPGEKGTGQHKWLPDWNTRKNLAFRFIYKGARERNWNIFFTGLTMSVPPAGIMLTGILLLLVAGLFILPGLVNLGFAALTAYLLHYAVSLILADPSNNTWILFKKMVHYHWKKVTDHFRKQKESLSSSVKGSSKEVKDIWKPGGTNIPMMKQGAS